MEMGNSEVFWTNAWAVKGTETADVAQLELGCW